MRDSGSYKINGVVMRLLARSALDREPADMKLGNYEPSIEGRIDRYRRNYDIYLQ